MKTLIGVGAYIERNEKILMGRKPKDIGPYPNKWHLPGGGIEENETVIECLEREIKEETGLTVIKYKEMFFSDDITENKHHKMTHYIFLVFEVEVNDIEPVAGDDLVVLKWIDKKELKQIPLTTPSIKMFKSLGYI
ncbi:MAG: hypothetical protein A3A51_00695 [Candidatus Levybacteria bacterium RIFCSPLOWO2_01_FULL_39_10]|nr:MAG: hypothetical protein A3A51_00695 [Candidatus Levybacteria bacterium RIFCSPLOWO2_01_FULL_39_10]